MQHHHLLALFRFFAALDALYFASHDAFGATTLAVPIASLIHPGLLLIFAFAVYEAGELGKQVRQAIRHRSKAGATTRRGPEPKRAQASVGKTTGLPGALERPDAFDKVDRD
jgi:hypothetical protein